MLLHYVVPIGVDVMAIALQVTLVNSVHNQLKGAYFMWF